MAQVLEVSVRLPEVNPDQTVVVYRNNCTFEIMTEPGDGFYTRYYGVTVSAANQREADDQFGDFEYEMEKQGTRGVGHEATGSDYPWVMVTDTFEPEDPADFAEDDAPDVEITAMDPNTLIPSPKCPNCGEPLTSGQIGITIAERNYGHVEWDGEIGGYIATSLHGDGDRQMLNGSGHWTMLLGCLRCHQEIPLTEAEEVVCDPSDNIWPRQLVPATADDLDERDPGVADPYLEGNPLPRYTDRSEEWASDAIVLDTIVLKCNLLLESWAEEDIESGGLSEAVHELRNALNGAGLLDIDGNYTRLAQED